MGAELTAPCQPSGSSRGGAWGFGVSLGAQRRQWARKGHQGQVAPSSGRSLVSQHSCGTKEVGEEKRFHRECP